MLDRTPEPTDGECRLTHLRCGWCGTPFVGERPNCSCRAKSMETPMPDRRYDEVLAALRMAIRDAVVATDSARELANGANINAECDRREAIYLREGPAWAHLRAEDGSCACGKRHAHA